MSHRTLLALAAPGGGYDCFETATVPTAAPFDRRRLDRRPDHRCEDRLAVYETVAASRHEALLVVTPTGPVRRYCVLSLTLDGFRQGPPNHSGTSHRVVLVEVDDDATETEFRRLWDGARAVVGVLVDDGRCPRGAATPILLRALDRLTYERSVVGPIPPD